MVFDPCAASVSTTGQPDGLSVGDGVQYRVDRACDGNLYYGKFWIWRNLYSGSPFFSTNVILAAVNGIYVGLLFCVLRNKMILKEPRSEKKNATV